MSGASPSRAAARPREDAGPRPRAIVRVRPRTETTVPPVKVVPSRPALADAWTRRLVIVVAALLGLLAIQSVVLLERDAPRALDQAPIESVAGDAVLSILQLAGGGTLNTTILTEELRASLVGGSESFVASLQESGYSPRGGPVEVAVAEHSDDSARAVVAAAGDIRDADGRAIGAHQLTFDLRLLKVDGQWLVDDIEVFS